VAEIAAEQKAARFSEAWKALLQKEPQFKLQGKCFPLKKM
jgi:hypothetical protein